MKKHYLIAVGIGIALIGASRRAPAPAAASDIGGRGATTSARSGSSVPDRSTIVRIVGRSESITVHASQQGPRYTVTTAHGETIAAGLTLDELRHAHPQAWQQVRGAHTDADSQIYAGSD